MAIGFPLRQQGALSAARVLCALVFLSLCSGRFLGAATYYVAPNGNDSSNGSSNAPFRTIQRAANVVDPGDTVIIRDGTYTGDSTSVANIGRSGTSSQWITFRAENEWGAIIDGRNNASQHGIDLDDGLGYVRIEGLQVQGTRSGGFLASDNTHDIVFYRNLLHDIGINCTDTTGGQVGFRDKASATRIVYDSNVLHTIGRRRPNEGCSSLSTDNYKNHDHGMYLRGSNLTIVNNVFYNIRSGWSIQSAQGANDWVIANNTFAFPNPDRDGHIVLWEANNNIVIANNIFYQPRGAAIDLSPCSNKSNVVVRNNINTTSKMITGRSCGTVSFSNNKVSTDPKLVNPQQGDFQLVSSSPAINIADASLSPTRDHAGGFRPQGNGPDIGAFEFGASDPANDADAPLVSITSPAPGERVSGTVAITATASDNIAVRGVRFQVNGADIGPENTTSDYTILWNTANVPNGLAVIGATARDPAGNLGSTALIVNVENPTDPGVDATPSSRPPTPRTR